MAVTEQSKPHQTPRSSGLVSSYSATHSLVLNRVNINTYSIVKAVFLWLHIHQPRRLILQDDSLESLHSGMQLGGGVQHKSSSARLNLAWPMCFRACATIKFRAPNHRWRKQLSPCTVAETFDSFAAAAAAVAAAAA